MRRALLVALLVAACSSDPNPPACTPGAQVACACVGGAQGAQACAADGSGYGACACPDGGASADAGPTDAGAADAGPADAGQLDAGQLDTGVLLDAPHDALALDREDASADASGDVSPGPGDNGPALDAPNDGGAADVRPGDAPEVGITCPLGLADCDGNPANGCEVNTQTDRLNCDACGRVCAETLPNVQLSSCRRGACQADSCDVGWGNCDAIPANGCETRLRTDPMHCGTCGNRCAMGQVCREADCFTP